MISNAIHLSELKVGVIINASSGGYDLECEHKMLDILKGAGIVDAKIWCGDTDQMERSFTEATREAGGACRAWRRRHHPHSCRKMRRRAIISYPTSRGNHEHAG